MRNFKGFVEKSKYRKMMSNIGLYRKIGSTKGVQKNPFGSIKSMREYTYITLRQKPQLKEEAAIWFHHKWGVPKEAYLECMEVYLSNETDFYERYGWKFLCMVQGNDEPEMTRMYIHR